MEKKIKDTIKVIEYSPESGLIILGEGVDESNLKQWQAKVQEWRDQQPPNPPGFDQNVYKEG